MNLVLSTLALALGLFAAFAPEQAARLWNPQRLNHLAPEGRRWFVRAYRLLGVVLSITGILFALDSFPIPH